MRYTQRMSAQPTPQIPVYRQLGESPIGHHVMPLWRRTEGGFAAFNGVDPNPFFDIFVNLNRGPTARDTLILRSCCNRLRFATLSFASSTDPVGGPCIRAMREQVARFRSSVGRTAAQEFAIAVLGHPLGACQMAFPSTARASWLACRIDVQDDIGDFGPIRPFRICIEQPQIRNQVL